MLHLRLSVIGYRYRGRFKRSSADKTRQNETVCRLREIGDVVSDTEPVNLAEMDKQREKKEMRGEELQRHKRSSHSCGEDKSICYVTQFMECLRPKL